MAVTKATAAPKPAEPVKMAPPAAKAAPMAVKAPAPADQAKVPSLAAAQKTSEAAQKASEAAAAAKRKRKLLGLYLSCSLYVVFFFMAGFSPLLYYCICQ